MQAKFAKLTEDWMLRGWSDVPCAVANWTNGDERMLRKKGAYVAKACDGQTDFESIAFLGEHRVLLDKLIEQGIAEACACGDALDPRQQFRKAPNPHIKGIHWCVTGLCNLNCRHCYMEAPSGRYGQLPFEDMLRLIDQFERANVHEVSVTGGEPFVRQDLLDILEALAQKRIRLSGIYTNGVLVTGETLERIKGLGFAPSLQISFDGCGAHDQMRGTSGIESCVIEAIKIARSSNLKVAVATCIDTTNVCQLGPTYDMMKRLDIDTWRIAQPLEIGNWRGATTALSIQEQFDALVPLARQWRDDGMPLSVEFGGFLRGSKDPETGRFSELHIQYVAESHDCGSCREQPNLLPDGTLLPCPAYTDSSLQHRMPNLLREDLSDVWTDSPLRALADLRKADLLKCNPDCATCELFKDCGMGCRASALMETGDLMAKDPLACVLWKEGYKQRFREAVGLDGEREA